MSRGMLWALACALTAIILGGCERSAGAGAKADDEPLSANPIVVFATAGDRNTVIPLPGAIDEPVRLVNAPRSIRLKDGELIVSHAVPVHEKAIVRRESSGETRIVWNATQPVDGPAYPLKISDSGRWLVDANGKPFQGNGEAIWTVFAQLDRQNVAFYFRDRSRKGVDLAVGRMIEHRFSNNDPVSANAFGETPFSARIGWGAFLGTGSEDFTTPNERYWRHVDWILREAYRYGIVFIVFPAYVGYGHDEAGWTEEMRANGPARMRAYGEFLGRRYASYPNIIWALGGDWGPVAGNSDVTAEVNALAEGIRSQDPVHLMTAKSERNRSSVDDYDQPWLDINAVYTWPTNTAEQFRRNRIKAPDMPAFLIEGYYGNEHGIDGFDIRRQIWQALLYGGFAHIYGNSPTWYFGRDSRASANYFADVKGLEWRYVLNRLGAQYLKYVAVLQAVRDFSKLEPDFERQVVPNEHVWAASNAEQLIAYVGAGTDKVAVNTAQFAAGRYFVNWYSPATGALVRRGSRSLVSREVTLEAPSRDDWILLLDNAELKAPEPGFPFAGEGVGDR